MAVRQESLSWKVSQGQRNELLGCLLGSCCSFPRLAGAGYGPEGGPGVFLSNHNLSNLSGIKYPPQQLEGASRGLTGEIPDSTVLVSRRGQELCQQLGVSLTRRPLFTARSRVRTFAPASGWLPVLGQRSGGVYAQAWLSSRSSTRFQEPSQVLRGNLIIPGSASWAFSAA